MKASTQSASRADQVRQRRTQHSQERVGRVTQQAARPANTPPVFVRGNSAGSPARQKTPTRTRRQYYYTLNATGAEVRLPALSLARPGWRLLSGALVIALLAAIFALWNLPMFQLGNARLVGAKRLTANDVNAVLGIEGVSVLEATPAQMEKDLLEAFPDLSSVSVRVGLPASLVVTVAERQPVLAWQQNEQTQWIDASGVAFPPRGDAPVENLVAVQAQGNPPSGAAASTQTDASAGAAASTQASASTPEAATNLGQPKVFLDPKLIPGILALSAEAPAGTPLVYDPRYGLGWTDPKGWQVYFGMDTTNVTQKLAEYHAIVDQLTQQGIQPKLISVEFLHAPFYRLEQ